MSATVPDEFWTETTRLATSGAIVAAVAVPIGILAREIVRSKRLALLPHVKPWRVPWSGFELALAFVLVFLVLYILLSCGITPLAAGVVALPIQLALLFGASRLLFPTWSPFERTELVPRIVGFARITAFAVAAWLVLAPLVLGLYAAVTQVFLAWEWPMERHPLTQLGGGALWERVLFLAQTCVAAPLIEEIVFRGLLLPWIIGARARNTGGVQLAPIAPPAIRPLIVMVAAALYAAISGKIGPVVFAGVLALGLAAMWFVVRKHKRHLRGIYASAALFALVHSAVWPSPIPLFVLGLGLGWLAVRTRGVLAPAIVHGLFNAISAFYVLRGSAV